MVGLGLALAMGIPALIGGIAQTGFGISDRKRAKQLEGEAGDRPQYEIPEGLNKMIALYEASARGGLPGEDIMKQDIQGATARGITAAAQLADSPVAALGASQASLAREDMAMNDLRVKSLQYQQMGQQNLARAYGTQAQYQDQQFNINQMQPWEINMNRADAYRFGGSANIFGGIDTAMSGITQGIGAGAQYNAYSNMMPNWGDQGASSTGGGNQATKYGNVTYPWG